MRKNISGILLIVLSGFILVLLSCAPGSCFDETESYVKASFYNYESEKLTTPDSLSLYGLNHDSIIYDKTAKVQPALIPLDASVDNCSLVIKINGVSDTIEFQYSSYPHLISKECGYTYYHHLDSIPFFSKNGIKKIDIINRTITNLNVENIQIYY
jgi:Family of unknown function (DUF6452)